MFTIMNMGAFSMGEIADPCKYLGTGKCKAGFMGCSYPSLRGECSEYRELTLKAAGKIPQTEQKQNTINTSL